MELRLARAQLLRVVELLLGPPRDLWVWLLVRHWVLESRLGKSRRVLLKR